MSWGGQVAQQGGPVGKQVTEGKSDQVSRRPGRMEGEREITAKG